MITIHRSPVGLVIKIIIVEVLIELLYLLLSAAILEVRGTLGESYASTRIIMSLVFMSMAVTAVIILVSQWVSESYAIKNTDLVVRRGTIEKTEVAYPYMNMQSVSVRQGILGRIFNYGQISIYIPTNSTSILLTDVADTKAVSEEIRSHIPYPDMGSIAVGNYSKNY